MNNDFIIYIYSPTRKHIYEETGVHMRRYSLKQNNLTKTCKASGFILFLNLAIMVLERQNINTITGLSL